MYVSLCKFWYKIYILCQPLEEMYKLMGLESTLYTLVLDIFCQKNVIYLYSLYLCIFMSDTSKICQQLSSFWSPLFVKKNAPKKLYQNTPKYHQTPPKNTPNILIYPQVSQKSTPKQPQTPPKYPKVPTKSFKNTPQCSENSSKYPQTPGIYPRGPKTPNNCQNYPQIKRGRKCRLAKLSNLGGIRAINIKFCLLQKYPFMSIYYSIEVLNM